VTASGGKECWLTRYWVLVLASVWVICSAEPSRAVEGPAAAGPIGGSDIRAALLPPSGLYGGAIGLYNAADGFNDGTGHPAAGLDAVDLRDSVGGPFFLYVPNFKVLGG
jgi:hypothetical protein